MNSRLSRTNYADGTSFCLIFSVRSRYIKKGYLKEKNKITYGAKKETYDHIHKKMNIVAYELESASQLIEDFWKSVDYYMENNT